MKIKEIISQSRRDFIAVYVCEHCGHEIKMGGYDDDNFHINVIPSFSCEKCGKKAGGDYKPMVTKYPEGFQV